MIHLYGLNKQKCPNIPIGLDKSMRLEIEEYRQKFLKSKISQDMNSPISLRYSVKLKNC